MKKKCFFIILIITFAIGTGLHAPSIVEGKVYKTKDDALKEVFPDADAVEKINVFLGKEEQKKIEAMAKSKLESRIFTFYAGRKGNIIVGYAVFGSHVVRTKQEVYMVVINPDSSIRQVEILAFYEPEEYLPSKRWFQRFAGKILDHELWPRRGIIAVTGATLSVNGITQEIRKVLAVFKIMVIKEG
ncbi:MAG: FMN-binding protein [Syntrophales bacterium]